MARTDPQFSSGYILKANDVTLAFLKEATFPTFHLLEFQVTFLPDDPFMDSMNNDGFLPYHRWALIMLDYSLHETGRLLWSRARVARVRFPALDVHSSTLLHTFVQMEVSDVRDASESTQDRRVTAASTTTGGSTVNHRRDPLPSFIFQWNVDGLETSAFSVTAIDAFYIGYGAAKELVLTVNPEQNADPYRHWRQDGNPARDGSLVLLDTSLHPAYAVGFTGLSVLDVSPPISTHAAQPAKVRLTYSGILLGADKKK